MSTIHVENLCKKYFVNERQKGLINNVKGFFVRKRKEIYAVSDISFDIEKGDVVGYIGPNGAGKSTTIKILTGILTPTSGTVSVSGLNPFKQRRIYAKKMGVIFGQRSQLWWDIPAKDSLNIMQYMYKMDAKTFNNNLAMFEELLDIKDFVDQPVRQLSLGQRMRVDFAAALLHDPEIVFLDEPTIGLDVVAKNKIRQFIKFISMEKKTTIILTTHDMSDIEKLCRRMILIDQGKIKYDGLLSEFKEKYNRNRQIIIKTALPSNDLQFALPGCGIEIADNETLQIKYDSSMIDSNQIISSLTGIIPIANVTIKDSEIEDVLIDLYKTKKY